MKRLLIALAMVAGTTLSGVAFSSPAGAITPPDPDVPVAQVDICHATGGDGNPYVINHPSVNSASTDGVPLVGHGGHVGPYWYPDHPKDFEWGDIIPPFTYLDNEGEEVHFIGLNWGDGGQAVYENDCALPHDSAPAPGVTQPTCENPLGAITFTNTDTYEYSVSPAFDGPGDYTVSVTAVGPVILDPPTSWEVTVDPAPDCRDTVTASAPSVSTSTCAAAGVLTIPADTDAIDYSVAPAYSPGDSGTFTVTATVDPALYVLQVEIDGNLTVIDDGSYDFPALEVEAQLADDDPACQERVEVPPVTWTVPDCLAAGELNVPADTEAIHYEVTENEDGTVTVTAEPTSGHWILEGTTQWANIELNQLEGVEHCVTTENPSLTPATCLAPGTLVLPLTEGVTYTTDGEGPGEVHVTASATIPGAAVFGPTSWTIAVPDRLTGGKCAPPPPVIPDTGADAPLSLLLAGGLMTGAGALMLGGVATTPGRGRRRA